MPSLAERSGGAYKFVPPGAETEANFRYQVARGLWMLAIGMEMA